MITRDYIQEDLNNHMFEREIAVVALKNEIENPFPTDDKFNRIIEKIHNCNWNIAFDYKRLEEIDRDEKKARGE